MFPKNEGQVKNSAKGEGSQGSLVSQKRKDRDEMSAHQRAEHERLA